MRKTFTIALVSLSGVVLTGCMSKGSMKYEFAMSVVSKLEEVYNGVNTTTEYEWTDDGLQTGEKQTVDGQLVYEDADFINEDTKITFTRTNYENGTVSSVEKHVTTYLLNNRVGLSSIEVFQVDGEQEILIESTKEEYDNQGRLSRHLVKKGDEIYLEQSDYAYDATTISYKMSGTSVSGVQKVVAEYLPGSNYGSLKKMTCTDWDNPDTEISRTEYETDTYGIVTGYKIYKNGSDRVSEEMSNYKADSATNQVSYDTKYYDESGMQTGQKTTTRTYKIVTITIEG